MLLQTNEKGEKEKLARSLNDNTAIRKGVSVFAYRKCLLYTQASLPGLMKYRKQRADEKNCRRDQEVRMKVG